MINNLKKLLKENSLICLLLSFFMFIAISGCTITSAATSMPTNSSQSTPTIRSLENSPTFTPLPSLTPDQTQIAFDQTSVAAQSAMQTEIAQFPRICKDNYYSPGHSPNGLWRVELCSSESGEGLIMTLSSRETNVLWKLTYSDYIPTYDIVPDGGMLVAHWSNDGRYAYFYSFLASDGGDCFLRATDGGIGLYRLDLQTGNTTTILPLHNNFGWYSFSFSPTDRRLVYGAYSRDLKVLDITTGQLIDIIPINNFGEAGGYLWSPDGLEFVYSTIINSEEKTVSSIRLVDAQSGSERILLESENDCYLAREWKENRILTIESFADQKLLAYDLKSNAISDAVITPQP